MPTNYDLKPKPGLIAGAWGGLKKGFGKVLDLISRPGYASAGYAKSLVTGQGNPLSAALRGLTGEDKTTYSDVLGEMGMKKGLGRTVLGFVGDVALDPTTYIGIGGAGKLTKAGEQATKDLLPDIAKKLASKTLPGEKALDSFQLDNLAKLSARATVSDMAKVKPNLISQGGLKFMGKSIIPQSTIAKSLPGRSLKTIGNVLSKGIDNVPEAQKLANSKLGNPISALTRKTSGVIDTLGGMFNPKRIPFGASSDFTKLQEAESIAKNRELFFKTKTKNEAIDIAKIWNKAGKGKEDFLDIADVFAGKKPYNKLDDVSKQVHDKMKVIVDDYTEFRKSIGKPVMEGENIPYFPHVHKPTAEQLRANKIKASFGDARDLSAKSPMDIGRQVFKFVDDKGDEIIGKADDFGLRSIDGAIDNAQNNIRQADNINNKLIAAKRVGNVDEVNKLNKSIKFVDRNGMGLDKYIQYQKDKMFRYNTLKQAMGDRVYLNTTDDIFKASLPTTREKIEAGYKMSTNPAEIVGTMGFSRSKQEAAHKFEQLTKGLFSDKPQKGMVKFTSDALPGLKGKYANEIDKAFVEKTFKAFTDVKELKSFIKAYDKANNWWKAWALVSPGYHTRNMVSNYFNNWIGGVGNPKYYKDGANLLLKQAQGKLDDVVKIGNVKATVGDWVSKLQKEGILNEGFYGDIAEEIETLIKGGKLATLGRNNKIMRASQKMGTFLEDSSKVAHVLGKMDKGYTLDKAVKSAQKYLFNYGDLTRFEEGIKKVIPFYTWSRKNIPLQITEAIKQPGKYLWIKKLSESTQKAFGNVETPYNDFSVPIAIKNKDGVTTYIDLQSFLPAADITKGFQPGETVLSGISPLIKTPAELTTNYSFFTQKPIERFPGETVNFMGRPVTRKTANVLNTFRPASEINRLNLGNLFGQRQGEISQPARIARLMTGARTYKYDPEMAQTYKELDYNKMKSQINTSLRNAIKSGDFVSARKLYQQLQEIEGNISKNTQKVMTGDVMKKLGL